jgi:hypothetical protein
MLGALTALLSEASGIDRMTHNASDIDVVRVQTSNSAVLLLRVVNNLYMC